MKIVLTHSKKLPWKEETYKALKDPSVNQGHEIFFPHEENAQGNFTRELIKDSDAVLAEVSYPSTGQGIELGWADTFNIPIICFYKEGSSLSNSLQRITSNFIEYSTTEDMIEKIASKLKEF